MPFSPLGLSSLLMNMKMMIMVVEMIPKLMILSDFDANGDGLERLEPGSRSHKTQFGFRRIRSVLIPSSQAGSFFSNEKAG